MHKTSCVVLVSLFILGLLLTEIGDSWAQQKVMFGTGSAISLTSAPLTMTIGMGFFKEEGLEVEVIPFKGGSGVLIPQIVNKSITIGFPTLDVMIIARQPGRDYMPLKFFYNMTRTSIYEIVVLDNSPIKQLSDLKGKTMGVGGLTWGSIPIAKAMFKEEGLEVGKDLELIAVGQGASAYQAMTSGRIAALYLFDVPHAELEAMGTKIRRLFIKEKYDTLGSNSLIAHEDIIKSQGNLLARFGRAIAKGTIASDVNTSAAVRMFWKYYPELKPTQGTEEEIIQNSVKVLSVRLKRMLSFPSGSPKRFGEFPHQMWKSYVEVLHTGGQTTTTDISVDSLYTNEFIQEFNAFDIQSVIREAKALK